jgi:hypothetical protein
MVLETNFDIGVLGSGTHWTARLGGSPVSFVISSESGSVGRLTSAYLENNSLKCRCSRSYFLDHLLVNLI